MRRLCQPVVLLTRVSGGCMGRTFRTLLCLRPFYHRLKQVGPKQCIEASHESSNDVDPFCGWMKFLGRSSILQDTPSKGTSESLLLNQSNVLTFFLLNAKRWRSLCFTFSMWSLRFRKGGPGFCFLFYIATMVALKHFGYVIVLKVWAALLIESLT